MEDKIKVERLSPIEYQVSLNIPFDEVDKKSDEVLNSIKAHTQVPGFRKGKAPLSRLKTIVGDRIKAPVAQMIIAEYVPMAISKAEISPVGKPVVKTQIDGADYPGRFGFDNSFYVELLFEVLPTIDPVGYKNMELDLPKQDVDKLFDKGMNEYRKKFAVKKQVDRGAMVGDTLVIDFVGYIGGNKFDGGSANNFTVNNLVGGSLIPGFEEQIVGMKAGETKNITVKFPDDYAASHLAGQDSVFEVKVHSVVETQLADADDDLAMMVGFDDIGSLKQHVLKEAENKSQSLVRQAADQQIVQKLLEQNDVHAPKSMVEDEVERLKGRVDLSKVPKEMMGNIMSQLRQQAEISVKRAIILDAIYEKEDDLEVSPEQLNDMLEQYAVANNRSKDEIVSSLYNSGQMENFTGVLRIKNVLDFIINNANVKDA